MTLKESTDIVGEAVCEEIAGRSEDQQSEADRLELAWKTILRALETVKESL